MLGGWLWRRVVHVRHGDLFQTRTTYGLCPQSLTRLLSDLPCGAGTFVMPRRLPLR